jgi:hypothetical protein
MELFYSARMARNAFTSSELRNVTIAPVTCVTPNGFRRNNSSTGLVFKAAW